MAALDEARQLAHPRAERVWRAVDVQAELALLVRVGRDGEHLSEAVEEVVGGSAKCATLGLEGRDVFQAASASLSASAAPRRWLVMATSLSAEVVSDRVCSRWVVATTSGQGRSKGPKPVIPGVTLVVANPQPTIFRLRWRSSLSRLRESVTTIQPWGRA